MLLYQLNEKMYVTFLASSKYLVNVSFAINSLMKKPYDFRSWNRVLKEFKQFVQGLSWFLLQSIHYSKKDAFCLQGMFNAKNQKCLLFI